MITKGSVLLILGLILSACFSPGVYVQKSTNIPAFEGKNEFKVSTTATFNELNVAYTPINHLGIIANGTYKHSKGSDVIIEDQAYSQHQKYRLGELGLGYYTNWDNNRWFFETYGGVGLGSTEYQEVIYKLFPIFDPDGIAYYKSRFTQLFVTPAGGYRLPFANDKCKMVFILSSNLNQIRFDNHSNAYNAPKTSSPYYFLSPGLTTRFQFSFFELQMQMVNHIQLNNETIPTYAPVFFFYDRYTYSKENWAFTLGVSVNLNQLVQSLRKNK